MPFAPVPAPTRLTYPPRSAATPPSPSHFVDVYQGIGQAHTLLLFLHGGFWKSKYGASPPSSSALLSILPSLCSTFATVAYVEYRRQPDDNPFSGYPYAGDDCSCAYDMLMSTIKPTPEKVVLMGHSAGGTLALMLSMERAVTRTYALAPVADLAMSARMKLSDNGDAVQLYAHGEPGEPGAIAYEQGCPTKMAWKMKDNTGGVTLVLGTNDADIPLEVVKSCHQELIKFQPECHLWRLDNADHFSILDGTSTEWAAILEDVRRVVQN